MNLTTSILSKTTSSFIVLRTNFESSHEAQIAGYLGRIETLRITPKNFDSLESAIEFAEESIKVGRENNLTVVYFEDRNSSFQSNIISNQACIYWDNVNSLIGTVTYPLAIAA